MRDLVLFGALVLLVPLIARAPFIGVLAWLWIALMNPQREVYTILAGFQLNLYIAVFTALAWLMSRERKTPPVDGFTILLVLFALWASVCTYVALDPATATPLWEQTMKTALLALAVTTLARSKPRIQAAIWIVVASLGYYAVKGGGFVLLTGAKHPVFGPPDSMIADNNALGLALVVVLPMMGYLFATSRQVFTRWALAGVMALTVIAILGTYSRGALLALAALVIFQVFRSRFGLVILAVGALAAAALPAVAPAGWLERMTTITTYQQDASFQGRAAAWTTSLNIARARPLTGGGFAAVELDTVARQFKSPGSLEHGRAAHSIYFQVLGETGFLGLALYMGMLAAAAANTVTVLGVARRRDDLAWARLLSRLLQCSLIGVLVGGAALSMAYYDGFLVLFALTSCLREVVQRQVSGAASIVEVDAQPFVAPWRRRGPGLAKPVGQTPGGLSFEGVRRRPPP